MWALFLYSFGKYYILKKEHMFDIINTGREVQIGKSKECVMGNYFICIDLKSFYASVECVERGLDPFRVNLVVADPTRSRSTICLAITPAMKLLGVKNRCRVHEIPPDVEYLTAMPRMQLYIEYAVRIYGIYLRYFAPEDIHVYSIDECFLDVTQYLELYHLSPADMAQELMDVILKETGITASAGIGTNLYLAKVAMDILAKRSEEHMAFLDEITFRKELWGHRPLTDFWRIGSGTARRLARYGLYTMGDIARMSLESEDFFYKLFGVDAELLIDHAWGVETCRMEDIKNYRASEHSLSQGQVLMRNYQYEEALLVLREMADLLALEMVERCVVTDSVSIWVSYDHRLERESSGGTEHLGRLTNSSQRIMQAVERVYRRIVDPHSGIRRLTVNANRIVPEGYEQYDLFSDQVQEERERRLQRFMIAVKQRYGKNAVMRASNLLECSTYRERNEQIGGHRA